MVNSIRTLSFVDLPLGRPNLFIFKCRWFSTSIQKENDFDWLNVYWMTQIKYCYILFLNNLKNDLDLIFHL